MSTKRLLGIFAHPDDEGSTSGAMLKYSTLDIETGLVCATRGEVGEIADPALATPENLGEVREGEMRAAAEVIGVHNLWFLGYRVLEALYLIQPLSLCGFSFYCLFLCLYLN